MRSEMHLGWRLPGERRLSARRRAKRLAAVMSCRLVTVGPATRVGDAADLAGEEGVHHLLVVDGASLVGVACEHDLLLAGRDARVGDCMNVPASAAAGPGLPGGAGPGWAGGAASPAVPWPAPAPGSGACRTGPSASTSARGSRRRPRPCASGR